MVFPSPTDLPTGFPPGARTTPLHRGEVLMTGGSGFLGSHLVAALMKRGIRPVLLGRGGPDPAIVENPQEIEVHQADLVDGASVREVIFRVKPQVVFHLGAFTGVQRTWEAQEVVREVNIEGTLHLIDACRRVGISRFVHVGTCEEYGDVPVPFREEGPIEPVSPYSAGKAYGTLLCRMLARCMDFPAVCLRPFLSYGPGQAPSRFISQAMRGALQGLPFPMTSGEQTREWNYAPDLVRGLVAAGSLPHLEGEVINVCSGVEMPVVEVARMIYRMAGADPSLVKVGSLPHRRGETWRFFGDPGKCRELLGYVPEIDLHEGLSRTLQWLRSTEGEGTGGQG